jgi:TnpA family transposase
VPAFAQFAAPLAAHLGVEPRCVAVPFSFTHPVIASADATWPIKFRSHGLNIYRQMSRISKCFTAGSACGPRISHQNDQKICLKGMGSKPEKT